MRVGVPHPNILLRRPVIDVWHWSAHQQFPLVPQHHHAKGGANPRPTICTVAVATIGHHRPTAPFVIHVSLV